MARKQAPRRSKQLAGAPQPTKALADAVVRELPTPTPTARLGAVGAARVRPALVVALGGTVALGLFFLLRPKAAQGAFDAAAKKIADAAETARLTVASVVGINQLRAALPGLSLADAAYYLPFLNRALEAAGITTPARVAAFLAQVGHESGDFKYWTEGLNYSSAARIRATWPSRFPTEASASAFVGKPEALANFVYANRMGNGSVASGDGWRYRGRGPIQLTGKDNYKAFSAAVGKDFVANPDLVAAPEWGFRAAAWFWQKNDLNRFADANDFIGLTKAINGGTVGLEDRQKRFAATTAAFNAAGGKPA